MSVPQVYVSFGNDGGIIQENAQEGYAQLTKTEFLAGKMTHEALCEEVRGRFITQAQFDEIIAASQGQGGIVNDVSA